MLQTTKYTRWKKNREFGQIFGGRERLKLKDNIFKRLHSFRKLGELEEKPVVLYDNPSKDFFFPISFEEIKNSLSPQEFDSFTHFWFKKIKKGNFISGEWKISDAICGSGVSLLIIYPFPRDLKIHEGEQMPNQKRIKHFQKYNAELRTDKLGFYFQFTETSLKNYYLKYAIKFV